jgi:hypothetical protein
MSLDTCTAVLVLLRHAMASKRKLLTLQDKIKVIQLSEGGYHRERLPMNSMLGGHRFNTF